MTKFEEWNKKGHLRDWDAAGYSLFNEMFIDWKAEREVFLECIEGLQIQMVNQDAERGKLIEALDKLYQATEADFYEIVGRSEDGHPLNALGVARQEARAVLEEAKGKE